MSVFKKIRTFIKNKSPATFNAVEYETGRLLSRINEKDAMFLRLQEQIAETNSELKTLSEFFHKYTELSVATTNKLQSEFNNMRTSIENNRAQIKNFDVELSDLKNKTVEHYNTTEKCIDEFNESVGKLKETIMRADLNSIVTCKSDSDFDKCMIPLNRYFNNRGMAISMHLTSVADKPDPIVYETADMIRTSTLSLIADEIHARNIGGSVAELGVAQGKFARVINALFPEKTLHLFDTFEVFPKKDIVFDKEKNFSNASSASYINIDTETLLNTFRYPKQCVIHKGYFPDTAVGFEERFCFVNIDCDLYMPIKAGLEYFYPRLLKGGCIFVHDYRSRYYTGVKVAVSEFAEKHEISYCVIPDNTGTVVIMK